MPRQTKKTRKKQNMSAGVLLGFFLALVSFAGYQAIAERREDLAKEVFEIEKTEESAKTENIQKKDTVDTQEKASENTDAVASGENANSKIESQDNGTDGEKPESQSSASAIGGPGIELQNYSTSQYSIDVPSSWYIDDSVQNRVAFGEKDPRQNEQYFGDLVVALVENPENLEIKEFYNSPDEADLFADALGGYQAYQNGEIQGYKFYDVQGYVPSNIIVIKNQKTGVILEISDIGGGLEKAGEFDTIVKTLSF